MTLLNLGVPTYTPQMFDYPKLYIMFRPICFRTTDCFQYNYKCNK